MILAIADDLTGALEVGAHFARFGITPCVTADPEGAGCSDAAAIVIDTETRHLAEHEAFAVTRGVLSGLVHLNPRLIYKKTDSTLRGNIASEFRALLETFPGRQLIYAPAYPEMHRTVREGCLFVHGIEVHRSVFANDPLNPVRTSQIAHLLGDIGGIAICDGETPGDITAVARRILTTHPTPLAAGPAALAGALARELGNGVSPPIPRLQRCLVVNGSMHPASSAQIAFARQHACLGSSWVHLEHNPPGHGAERAARLGEHVRYLLETDPLEGLIVFGGDTAFGIHRALGAHPFRPYGEVIQGVPVSRSGNLYWVTKAGGFGAPDLLCELRKRLT